MSERRFHVYFDYDPDPDLSWLDADDDPDDHATLMAWVTVECPCCGQKRTVASRDGIDFNAGTETTGCWSEEQVSPSYMQDAYQREIAEQLLDEAREVAS